MEKLSGPALAAAIASELGNHIYDLVVDSDVAQVLDEEGRDTGERYVDTHIPEAMPQAFIIELASGRRFRVVVEELS